MRVKVITVIQLDTLQYPVFQYEICLTHAQMNTVLYRIIVMNSSVTPDLLFFMSYLISKCYVHLFLAHEMHCVSSRIMEERALWILRYVPKPMKNLVWLLVSQFAKNPSAAGLTNRIYFLSELQRECWDGN